MLEEVEEAHLHAHENCSRKVAGSLTEISCEEFGQLIFYTQDSHSCFRCGLSQRLCVTEQGNEMACQWPNVMVPMMWGVIQSAQGQLVVQKIGYREHMSDWTEYGRWLGQRHRQQVWGSWMSKVMVVMIRMIEQIGGEDRIE